jgi:2-polyprenyl-3-methyl-5-hydroxy-6-metoxy-1,4-benzoquinol methylase
MSTTAPQAPGRIAFSSSRPAPACIVCGSGRWEPRFRVLLRCAECGFIRADAELSHEEVKRLYREGYFRGGQEYGDYLAEVDSHRKNFARRWETVAGLAGRLGSLFEVGCAYGFWLEQCSRQGVDCAGVDVCEEAAAYATGPLGQRATAGDFLELPLPAGRYQAFCMWDTIEHLANPEKFVARISALLPPGGWFFLTTGDIGSLLARLRGRHWRLIHPPTHLQYFSRATMARFLARHGLEVVAVRSEPSWRTVAETLGRLGNLGRGLPRVVGRVLSRALPGWVQRRGVWADLGDIMFVAARKAA